MLDNYPENACDIPEPPASGLLGNLGDVKNDFYGSMTRWWQTYGDVVRFRLGRKPVYLISHPVLAEQVLINYQDNFQKVYNPEKPKGLSLVLGNGLVTSQGEFWQKQRRLIQPMFHKSRLYALSDQIVSAVTTLMQGWQQSDLSRPVDVSQEMTRVTLDIITRTMFSTSVNYDVGSFASALKAVLAFVQKNAFNPLALPLYIPTRENRMFRRNKSLLDNLIHSIIAERISSGERHDDLLDLLLHTTDEDTGEKMPAQQVLDEALTIFSAGHETTANAMSWVWHLLSSNPQVNEKLLLELDRVLGGRVPQVTDLVDLPFTRAVLEEAMRLYPPVVVLLRKAVSHTRINDYEFEKNALVIVNIRNIHHHPDLWPEPEKFDPQRFIEKASGRSGTRASRLSYMPFGAGQRVCLGSHLALLEGQILLASIAQKYELKTIEGFKVVEDLAISLRPGNGLLMSLTQR